MFLISKYEQNELSYMKIRPQIKKLAFSPSPGGRPFSGGPKMDFRWVEKWNPNFMA